MTELEKMMAFHVLQTFKEAPDWLQDANLVLICKMDKTGRFERLARILAAHKVPSNEVVPCVMDIMQEMLFNTKGEAENGTETDR